MRSVEFQRALRRCGFTQARFARIARVSRVAVSYWCTGRRPVPKLIADLLLAHEARLLNLRVLESPDERN